MKKQNINAIYILLINISTITLLTLINAKLATLGLFLYLPGIFFFNACKFINLNKGILISGFGGFVLDQILETPFGFHGILLPFFLIICRKWLETTVSNKPWRPVIFQLLVNIIFHTIWFSWVTLDRSLEMNWSTSRFCIDLILSSLILIPLSFWIYGLTEIFVITKRDENFINEKTL
jgi:hypothetical protein